MADRSAFECRMRLADAAGLVKDVFLDTKIPYLRLCERRGAPKDEKQWTGVP